MPWISCYQGMVDDQVALRRRVYAHEGAPDVGPHPPWRAGILSFSWIMQTPRLTLYRPQSFRSTMPPSVANYGSTSAFGLNISMPWPPRSTRGSAAGESSETLCSGHRGGRPADPGAPTNTGVPTLLFDHSQGHTWISGALAVTLSELVFRQPPTAHSARTLQFRRLAVRDKQ